LCEFYEFMLVFLFCLSIFVKCWWKYVFCVSFYEFCFFCMKCMNLGVWEPKSVWNWWILYFFWIWWISSVCTWFFVFWVNFLFETEVFACFFCFEVIFFVFSMIFMIFLWFLWFFLWFLWILWIFLWFLWFFYDFLWIFSMNFVDCRDVFLLCIFVEGIWNPVSKCWILCQNVGFGGPMEFGFFRVFGNSMDFEVFLDFLWIWILWILWIFMILWFFYDFYDFFYDFMIFLWFFYDFFMIFLFFSLNVWIFFVSMNFFCCCEFFCEVLWIFEFYVKYMNFWKVYDFMKFLWILWIFFLCIYIYIYIYEFLWILCDPPRICFVVCFVKFVNSMWSIWIL
jgi:hypothetical protein